MRIKNTIVISFVLLFSMSTNMSADTKLKKATFGGGCFWCMEHPFEELDGVLDVSSGYTGGHKNNPSYKEVSAGKTGHLEAVQITYDPNLVDYSTLLDVFWRQINPTDPNGQFNDRGSQYRTAIFYHDQEQKDLAEQSKEQLDKSGTYPDPVVTEIINASDFYRAEDYHQDYYKKSPLPYSFYRARSGRDHYLKKIWKDRPFMKKSSSVTQKYAKPSNDVLKAKLTPLQYQVTQKNGTERPFKNEYWDNKKEGIYVDIVSGEPLFSSKDKFDSKTGWPSFTRPIVEENIVEKEDRNFWGVRTEVRSKHGDSHLGHVFEDGPEPTGLRYCLNSAALRFIPKEDLEKLGYPSSF